jgi:hypothetical protein
MNKKSHTVFLPSNDRWITLKDLSEEGLHGDIHPLLIMMDDNNNE